MIACDGPSDAPSPTPTTSVSPSTDASGPPALPVQRPPRAIPEVEIVAGERPQVGKQVYFSWWLNGRRVLQEPPSDIRWNPVVTVKRTAELLWLVETQSLPISGWVSYFRSPGERGRPGKLIKRIDCNPFPAYANTRCKLEERPGRPFVRVRAPRLPGSGRLFALVYLAWDVPPGTIFQGEEVRIPRLSASWGFQIRTGRSR